MEAEIALVSDEPRRNIPGGISAGSMLCLAIFLCMQKAASKEVPLTSLLLSGDHRIINHRITGWFGLEGALKII